jgi:mono/diheme cytochrome c family protein
MNKKTAATKSLAERLKGQLPALAVLAVVGGGVWVMINQAMNDGGSAAVDVKVPVLSAAGRKGEEAFAENCAACHGENAAGGPGGPPLVHKIYTPGHHADGAFMLAVRRGVRRHHWQFGNMPPQRHVSAEDTKAIIGYVRELQVANGIGSR